MGRQLCKGALELAVATQYATCLFRGLTTLNLLPAGSVPWLAFSMATVCRMLACTAAVVLMLLPFSQAQVLPDVSLLPSSCFSPPHVSSVRLIVLGPSLT